MSDTASEEFTDEQLKFIRQNREVLHDLLKTQERVAHIQDLVRVVTFCQVCTRVHHIDWECDFCDKLLCEACLAFWCTHCERGVCQECHDGQRHRICEMCR